MNKNQNVEVNTLVPEGDCRVPMQNMIYIADSPSDVLSFSLVNSKGGKMPGVHAPGPATTTMTAAGFAKWDDEAYGQRESAAEHRSILEQMTGRQAADAHHRWPTEALGAAVTTQQDMAAPNWDAYRQNRAPSSRRSPRGNQQRAGVPARQTLAPSAQNRLVARGGAHACRFAFVSETWKSGTRVISATEGPPPVTLVLDDVAEAAELVPQDLADIDLTSIEVRASFAGPSRGSADMLPEILVVVEQVTLGAAGSGVWFALQTAIEKIAARRRQKSADLATAKQAVTIMVPTEHGPALAQRALLGPLDSAGEQASFERIVTSMIENASGQT